MKQVWRGSGCKAPKKINVVSRRKSVVNLELRVLVLWKQPAIIWIGGWLVNRICIEASAKRKTQVPADS
jgi:hypothetical protein